MKHSLNKSGEEKWAKHYSNQHRILLVGEGDFSFSASLAAAFGFASNMTATSLDSEGDLWNVYDRAVYNIEELMRKGCKVIHGVNVASMDSHPSLKDLTFDRIIFNFPFAGVSMISKGSQHCPHRGLVKAFLRAAKEMIDEDGEIHITQRTDGILGEMKIEFIAFQQWLELVGVVDFNVSDYPGYSPKWELGNGYNVEYIPPSSRTYKFRRPHHPLPPPPPKIVHHALAASSNSSSVNDDYVPNFVNANNISQRASSSSDTTCICNKDDGSGDSKYWCHCHMRRELPTKTTGWCMYPSPSMILQPTPYGGATCSNSGQYHHHQNFVSPTTYYSAIKQQNELAGLQQERWIKHYSNRHKILLVGEGDFSFSASLAVAFGFASNVTATSLDSEEFLTFHYCKAFIHLKELKNRGCKVIHGVDATSMAYHPSLMGSTFDRIIFNFPYAGFFNDSSRQSKISCHQSMIWMFLENAKQMLSQNGEIHITHKTNGFHQQWGIVSLAIQQGLELVDSVEFNVSDYPGYSNKYGFGGDNSFDCSPSKTYMFRLPRTTWPGRLPWV
ncbi:PREDICTED: uncharacterized protein LOC109178068 [Ipomoea nil]|uniref:uncharacterized protein LOC109178068 n=1 Tax=Ipomoea nil TaxID=35883 RepID=UPI000900ED7F|nr:PREDICTED: uncharacterized protein LOC109178068 [Ipomoea nil]